MKEQLIIHYQNEAFKNRIAYVFDFLKHHPLAPPNVHMVLNGALDASGIHLFYQSGKSSQPNHFYIEAQEVIFSKTVYPTKTLFANSYQVKKEVLYSVEKEQKAAQDFVKNNCFQFDLVEMLFFHLSRYEEYHCPKELHDAYDMMQTKEQFLVRYKIHQIPVVDHLVSAFYKMLGFDFGRKKTPYRMTHDIDVIFRFPSIYKLSRSAARILSKGEGANRLGKLFYAYFKTTIFNQKDPFDTFDWLLQKANYEQVIYFIAGGKTKYENFYKIDDPYVLEIIKSAQGLGYEIGLHPSYATFDKEKLLADEKLQLEQISNSTVQYSRQHFLHYSFEKTASILEKTNIQNDSTFGFQDVIGFRSGTGFEYHPYHFGEERKCTFTETPMVVMDTALLQEVEEDIEKARIVLFYFLKKNKENTKITFNFHNSTFDEVYRDAKELRKLYEDVRRFLEYKVG